jgi:replicative DNA helicase
MKDHFIDYQHRIDEQALRNELKKAVFRKKIKNKDIRSYVETFKKIKVPVLGKTYVADELTTFCRHQAIFKAALEVPDLLTKRDFDGLEQKWKEALQVGIVHDIGTEYFMSYPLRIRNREDHHKRIMPTGITEIDQYLGGGLRPKQLGIWMGPVNRGKSLALMHCAKRAIIAGKRVIHYTLEMSEEEVSERYDSAFSRIPMKLLGAQEGQLIKFLEKEGIKRGNSLIIKEYPTKKATLGMIMSHYRMCLQSGFIPDLVIVDYLDLIKPSQKRSAKREELTDITEEMRGAAGETDIPWWTATQSRRAAISMELHTEEEVGEDIGKINTADVAITLNQTQEELHQNIMRGFLAKNRNGPKYRTVKFSTDFDRMCFYEPFATSALATTSGTPNSANTTGKPAAVPNTGKRKPAKKKTAHSPMTGGLIRT